MQYKEISLTRGLKTIVDVDDFYMLSKYKWYSSNCNGLWYATNKRRDGCLRIHRIVMGAKPGEFVDHINRNTLDNRKKNLRICSRSQNQLNRNLQSNNKSGHRGVYKNNYGKWVANIKHHGKTLYLGAFTNKADAVDVFNKKAKDLRGIVYNK